MNKANRSRSAALRARTLAIALGIAFISVAVLFVASAAEEQPEFWYPTDPELELIRIDFFGGMRGTQSRYSVFADGRLVIKRTAREDLAIPLSDAQVDELVATAVNGQLLNVDEARQVILRDLPRKIINSDAGAVRVTVTIPNFKRTASAKESEVTQQVTLAQFSTYATHFSDVEEVGCIVQLTRAVRSLEKQARSGGES